MIQSHATISIEELVNVLEPLIRRVVREELAEAIEKSRIFFILNRIRRFMRICWKSVKGKEKMI